MSHSGSINRWSRALFIRSLSASDLGCAAIRQFEDQFVPCPPASCWVWVGSILPNGYGRFSFRKDGCVQSHRAHRVSYAIQNGSVPANLLVCHSCDVRLCVNPNHLFVGTHSDNALDMLRKGRHPEIFKNLTVKNTSCEHLRGIDRKGTKNGRAKLNEKTVLEIAQSSATTRELSLKLGINYNTIGNIRDGRHWTHLTGILPKTRTN